MESMVSADIWTVSPTGDRVPYLVTPFADGNHDLSPDGRWMAYNSNESGQLEVYIQRYSEPGEKVTVSTGGGVEPLWSPEGSELFYRNLTGDRMMVVTVSTEPTVLVSRSEVLFEG
jgi:Tol biopolymer transport system component